jgi:hypothetical protein
MKSVKGMFEDFTEVSCVLCKKLTGAKNCARHRKDCLKRNLFLADELTKRGWVKRDDADSKHTEDYTLVPKQLLKELIEASENVSKLPDTRFIDGVVDLKNITDKVKKSVWE